MNEGLGIYFLPCIMKKQFKISVTYPESRTKGLYTQNRHLFSEDFYLKYADKACFLQPYQPSIDLSCHERSLLVMYNVSIFINLAITKAWHINNVIVG